MAQLVHVKDLSVAYHTRGFSIPVLAFVALSPAPAPIVTASLLKPFSLAIMYTWIAEKSQ